MHRAPSSWANSGGVATRSRGVACIAGNRTFAARSCPTRSRSCSYRNSDRSALTTLQMREPGSKSPRADRAERRISVGAGYSLLSDSRDRVNRCGRTRGDELTGVVVRLPSAPGVLLTKKQLALELARSTRWIELRMREGLPVQPRRSPGEHARFDLEEVRRWLDRRSRPTAVREERVARLEREVARLAAALGVERSKGGDSQAR
jgi:hypothetical protein